MYRRTPLGQRELLTRQLKLPSRARTLLLLIETADLHLLDPKINRQDHINLLLSLHLIYPKTEHSNMHKLDTEFEPPTPNFNPQLSPRQVIQQDSKLIDIPAVKHLMQSPLAFKDIKVMMQCTLQQNAGLLAKGLIEQIIAAQTVAQLREYQGKWLTELLETRISRQQLAEIKQQINLSLACIENTATHQH